MINMSPSKSKLIWLLLFLLATTACTLQQSTRKDEPDVDIFEIERLAIAAYDIGDMLESEKYYTILVQKIPKETLHWFRLGNIYARTNRPDAAVFAYRESLIRDPKLVKSWYNMGIVQLKQAAHSFNELQINTDSEHPLHEQGEKVFDGILGLIKGDKATQ